jgi:NAD(P)-dependent dehydrogenase (short-subunit alcohol dehydrogenase family)
VWRTDRAVIEHITARRGYLLNISSLSAITHAPMLGAYSTAKAGVEALSDALRLETLPSGAHVGCAYFGFIDTDLVRGGFAGPSGQAARSQMPGFIGKPAPVAKAIDAIEDGIERRAARIWAPRWVGPMLLLRGLVQPIIDRGVLRDLKPLEESLRLADPSVSEVADQDPLLGVSAAAVKPTR